jgi:hypothetical protein
LNTLLSPHNDSYRLKRVGCDHAHLCYANFSNGIAATPYAILVDEEKKSVVITVRGTLSLEDWVIDLQYVPLPLDDVGEICGFDGKGHHCHKGEPRLVFQKRECTLNLLHTICIMYMCRGADTYEMAV